MTETNKTETKTNREIPYHRGEPRLVGGGKSAGRRKDMTKALEGHWLEIVKKSGNVFVSASEVLENLHAEGLLTDVKKANGVGDVLGAKGFKLPHAIPNGKRLYFLPAIAWDEAMLREFMELSLSEQSEKAQALEQELLGVEPNIPEEVRAVAQTLSDEADEPETVWSAEDDEEEQDAA